MNFLEEQIIYVKNMCAEFEGQKMNPKKDIHNVPACVVLKNS